MTIVGPSSEVSKDKVSVEEFVAENHYNIIKSWWKKYGHPIIPLDHLSNIGFVSYIGDKPVGAYWLYTTNSAHCYVEHFVKNPDSTKDEYKASFPFGIEMVCAVAKSLGYKTISTRIKRKAFQKIFQRQSFEVQVNNMSELNRGL